MLCKQCGFNHGSQANFCPACGYKVSEQDRQEFLSGQHSTKWFKILFGLSLLGLAVSIFLILFSDNMTKVVADQLQAIKDNRLTEAYYNYSSKSYQKATPLEDFRQFFQNYPFFSHYQSVRFVDRDNTPTAGILRAMMMTDQGVEIPLEFELVKEGDQWLIENMKFEDPLAEENTSTANHEGTFDDTPLKSAIYGLMDQIHSGNLNKAYQDYTSKDFKKTTSLQAFEQFIKENPDFSNNRTIELKDLTFDNNIATMKGSLTGPDSKRLEVEYDLIEEDGVWKVFHVQIYRFNNQAVADLQYSKFILGDELDGKNLVKMPKTVFKDRSKEIYLNLYLDQVKRGTAIEIVFEHLDTGSTIAPVSKVISDEGNVILTFVFSPPDSGWPKGNYRLLATSSTGKKESYHFKLET